MAHRKSKNESVGTQCPYCKRTMISHTKITDDHSKGLVATSEHKIPQQRGGSTEPFNIIIVCMRCNNLRGHMDIDAFLEFARVVIQKYPDAPTMFLRNSMHEFQMQLIEVAVKNKRALRRASSLALLHFAASQK